MNIITMPTVKAIAYSQYVGSPDFDIPDDGDDHTKIGSFAAKVCYDSSGKEGRANEANQRQVMEQLHGSVLEHSTVSLYITGVTRGLTLELNRHRTFGISQRSTRYTAEEDASIVLDPYYAELYTRYVDFLDDPNKDDISAVPHFNVNELNLIGHHLAALEAAFETYETEVMWLTKLNPGKLEGFELRKWCRGKARNLLPHALESRGVWTNNHRGWRWFIEARSDRHAEPEIRRLADVVLKELRTVAPLYYADFTNPGGSADTPQGIPEWKPTYHKI